MNNLGAMLRDQAELQKALDGRAFDTDPTTTCEYIKDMTLAAMDELHELLGEVGWKPWATSKHVHVDEARGEWIDAWHFMMNLANTLGMTEDMIVEMYYAKAHINKKRMLQGYDGVSTKCPNCKRALDDPVTNCYRAENGQGVWCDQVMAWV